MSALTIARRPLTRQTFQHVADILDAHTDDGEFVASLVERLGLMLKGSLYSEHGSVELSDVAGTMQKEIEAFVTPEWCGSCAGTGEGQHDGTRCYSCHGRGARPSPREVVERERMGV